MSYDVQMEKLNAILSDMNKTDANGKEQLKQHFCDEMVSLIEELESTRLIVGETIAQVYLEDVKAGNYIKAIDCMEYVEKLNI